MSVPLTSVYGLPMVRHETSKGYPLSQHAMGLNSLFVCSGERPTLTSLRSCAVRSARACSIMQQSSGGCAMVEPVVSSSTTDRWARVKRRSRCRRTSITASRAESVC